MDLVDVFAVFALFVFMLSLLCFYALPFSSANKDLYNDHVTSYLLNVTLFQVEMVIKIKFGFFRILRIPPSSVYQIKFLTLFLDFGEELCCLEGINFLLKRLVCNIGRVFLIWIFFACYT